MKASIEGSRNFRVVNHYFIIYRLYLGWGGGDKRGF